MLLTECFYAVCCQLIAAELPTDCCQVSCCWAVCCPLLLLNCLLSPDYCQLIDAELPVVTWYCWKLLVVNWLSLSCCYRLLSLSCCYRLLSLSCCRLVVSERLLSTGYLWAVVVEYRWQKLQGCNIISELMTFGITKAKVNVKFGVKYLCEPECERSSVAITINTRTKTTKYLGKINFTSTCVAPVVAFALLWSTGCLWRLLSSDCLWAAVVD